MCLGGAILTKGLSGVAIVGLAHATVLLIERRLRVAVIAGGVLALLIGVAVAAPWFVAMEHAHPGYLDYYLLQRHVLGFTTETQRHGKSAWHYYVPVVLGGGLPWILYAPFAPGQTAPARGGRATERRFADAARLGWSLLLTGTLFLSLAKSKLLTYALPVFPAIALLAAVAWLAWARAPRRPPVALVRADAGVQAAVGALLLPAALVFAPAKFPVPHVGWMWAVAAAIAAGWWVAARVAVAAHRRRRPRLAPTLTASTLVVALAVLVPPVANVTTARDLAQTINRSGRFPARAVDGGAAFRFAGLLSRSGAPARSHAPSASCSCHRRRCPSTSRCPARAWRSPSATRRGSNATCGSKGSPTSLPGTTACTIGERLLHSDAPLNTQPVPAHVPHHRPAARVRSREARLRPGDW